jgi:alpha-L-rhamnosidase
MSLNHCAFGCVDDWIFRYVSGIDHAEAGSKRIVIQPRLDKRILWAKRRFSSDYGDIILDWRIEAGEFRINVKIPCNTSADVILPDGTKHSIGSGKYSFSCMIPGKTLN